MVSLKMGTLRDKGYTTSSPRKYVCGYECTNVDNLDSPLYHRIIRKLILDGYSKIICLTLQFGLTSMMKLILHQPKIMSAKIQLQ